MKRKEEKDKRILISWMDWYWLCVLTFFMTPKVILRRVLLENTLRQGSLLHLILYDYHNLISLALIIIGVLLFVLSLEKGTYRYQF